jgi:dihydroorotase
MTDGILIRGGHVVDPANGRDGVADVLVAGGRIAAVGKIASADARGHGVTGDLSEYDARGLHVLPGLVDLRTHFGEPGHDSEETLAHGARVAVHGGFTTVACLPDTEPPLDNVAAALFVRRQSEQAGFADVHPICAFTLGRQGRELTEIGQLVEAGAVAFSDEQRALNEPAGILRGMQYVAMFDRAVIEISQDPELASGVMNSGHEATLAGLPGIPAVAEELAVARACMFARETGCHFHAGALSARNAVRAVRRARKLGVNVTADVCAHHLAFTDAAVRGRYDTRFKVFPPFRGAEDIAWLKRGLREGAIDCISSGHVPVPAQMKELEFGLAPFGAVGLETALSAAVTHLVATGDLSLNQLVAKLTINPARILRLHHRKGALTEGFDGDLCLFDAKAQWQVTPETLTSRAKNSPLIGATLTGRVKAAVTRNRLFPVS